jgi:hypothetical protein
LDRQSGKRFRGPMRLAGRHAARRWIEDIHCQLAALGKECERRNPVAECRKPEPNFQLDKAYGPVGAIPA